MPKTYTNLLTHVVFSTKERLPLIENEIKARLFAYLGGIIREVGACCHYCRGNKRPHTFAFGFAAYFGVVGRNENGKNKFISLDARAGLLSI
jgi:hypothetical protein